MLKNIFIILVVLILVFASVFVIYNYIPLGVFDLISVNKPAYGTTLITIQGSDTLSSSRTIINNNFTALNDGKIENSSTSIAAITTLQNLTSVGTIATGVWGGTAINVNKGGTGSTSLAQYQVLLGSSTNAIGVVSGYGTAGQFLTSGGASVAPTWTTSALSLSDDYAWTGDHSWSQLTSFASSTFSATSTFNGRITSDTASTTVYNDLNIMGSLKYAGTLYGGAMQTCVGSTTISLSYPSSGVDSTVITCGFQPSIINFLATVNKANLSGFASSAGYSINSSNNFSLAQIITTDGATRKTWMYSTSSIAIYHETGGNFFYLLGSSTPSATGFTINYAYANYWNNGTEPIIINWVAY